MNELYITRAREDDLPLCAQIIVEAHNELGRANGLAVNDSPVPALERLKDERFAGARAYLVREGEAFVGTFSLCRLGEDEEAYELSKMSVRPDAQGRGVGSFMLEKARAAASAEGGACVVAAVLDINEPVIQWLSRRGFWVEAALSPEGLGCGVCIMQKNIEPAKCGGCG